MVVQLDQIPVRSLLDTGATKNFVSKKWFRNTFRNKTVHKNNQIQVLSAQGKDCTVWGQFTAVVRIQTETLRAHFYIVQELQEDVILGIDFLQRAKVVLDFPRESISVQMNQESKKGTNQLDIKWEESVLTHNQKEKLMQVLQDFTELFSENPGLTHVTTHTIDTGEGTPIKVRPYRYDQVKERIIEQHIEEMLKQNIIKPINSPWASPIVLCKKKGDLPLTDPKAWRFAIDYRALNKVTKFPAYPMPLIEDIVHSFKAVNYLTTLDLTSGYYQVAVNENDIPKTSFISKKGSYAFVRMPFGLAGAPATFQRAMDAILKPVLGQNVCVYLDDIILSSKTFEEHTELLAKVLTLIKESGLTINLKKCKFARKELQYLGFKITQNGLEADDSKIQAVKDFKIPKSARQLASFLGLCSYYRNFIPSFSEIAEPLYILRRQRTKFCWSSETQDAFEKLKNALIQAPVLGHPDPQKPFIIHTDSSAVGVGAVMSQEGRPIAYVSRTLNAAERNYTTTEREILAIVFAVNKFKGYFTERPVVIYTDHAALTKLYTGKNLTPRVIRWALKLQEYNLDIQFKSGKENRVADALSRAPYQTESGKIRCALLTTAVLQNREKLATELKRDPKFADIYTYLKDPANYHAHNKVEIQNRSKNYELVDEILFYTLRRNEFGELRPVIPESMRMEILHDLHDLPMCGHMGIRKTFARAREAVYWPKLKEWVTQYVRSCDTCQRINYVNHKPAGYLTNIVATFPNAIVGVDLLGPYPRSAHGKFRYLLVIVDHFSKWVEIVPLRRASAQAVTNAFMHNYVFQYSAPVQLISDNGQQFVSKIFEDMCEKLNIKHCKMVTYRAQSNIAERVNRNIVRMIAAYIEKYHQNWDKYIQEFTYALRTAQHDSTGKTPAEVFLGRKLMTPLDRMFFVQQREAEFQMKDIEQLLHETRKWNDTARKIQKKYYDTKRRENTVQVGDWVLIATHQLSSAQKHFVSKFAPKFEGPYLVKSSKNNVLIIQKHGKEISVNVDQCRVYISRQTMVDLDKKLERKAKGIQSSELNDQNEARPSKAQKRVADTPIEEAENKQQNPDYQNERNPTQSPSKRDHENGGQTEKKVKFRIPEPHGKGKRKFSNGGAVPEKKCKKKEGRAKPYVYTRRLNPENVRREIIGRRIPTGSYTNEGSGLRTGLPKGSSHDTQKQPISKGQHRQTQSAVSSPVAQKRQLTDGVSGQYEKQPRYELRKRTAKTQIGASQRKQRISTVMPDKKKYRRDTRMSGKSTRKPRVRKEWCIPHSDVGWTAWLDKVQTQMSGDVSS